jgi:hypothetical protein
MKYVKTILLAAVLTVTVAGQSPEKILKLAEKALGGEKAIRSEQSLVRKGHVTRLSDGAAGSYVSRTAEPVLFNEKIEINGYEIEIGTNGRSGWQRNSRDGLRTLTGDASIEIRAKAAYRNHMWLERKREKSKITYTGQTVVDGKTVNVVNLTTVRGVTIKIYLDVATNLPVRDEIIFGSGVETRTYNDYRTVGVTQMPYLERITAGGQTYELKFDSLITNQPFDTGVFDFPTVSKEPLPDIRQLLDELQANEDRVESLLDNYSFTQKIIKRELKKDGVLRDVSSETYQMSFYKGQRIKRLIEKDGKPLNEKDQMDEDREVAQRVDEIERRLAKREGKPDADEDKRISIAEMLRASNLINPRRERFRDRAVIVFDFEPNPAFDYKNSKSILKFFGKTTGVMWIDENDKQVTRLEASLSESFGIGGGVVAKLKKGASFSLEQERVNNEIWLPSLAEINLSVRVLLVKGIDLNQVLRSYNYRRFETEVKDAKVDQPKKPE